METCWFCETRSADANAGLKVTLRGKKLGTRHTGFKEYTTYYDSRTITVPRCAECESIHHKRRSWNILIGLAVIGPIGISLFITSWFADLGTLLDTVIVCGSGLLGIGLAIFLASRLALNTQGTKNEGYKAEYPPVKELKGQGWTSM